MTISWLDSHKGVWCWTKKKYENECWAGLWHISKDSSRRYKDQCLHYKLASEEKWSEEVKIYSASEERYKKDETINGTEYKYIGIE